MSDETRQLFKSLGFLGSVGTNLVAASIVGLAMGYYLDRWLDTGHWMTLIFLGLGIVAGFRNVYRMTSREIRRQQEEDKGDDGPG